MDHAVPSSGNEGILIDKLYCENAVVMAYVVPSSGFEIGQYGLGI
jgi:hypothetical protein